MNLIILTSLLIIIIIFFYKKSIKNTEKFEEIQRVIPLNIYQTWDTLDLPPKMKVSIEKLRLNNPEFNYYLFDNVMRHDFIKNNFPQEVADAYDNLIPGAYKADLWRYCIIYINGGIYLDIKFQTINNFKLIDLVDKEYFMRDTKESGHGIYQAILICKPRNEKILKTINKIVENVKNKYYGESIFSPTGPWLLRDQFTEDELKDIDNNGLSFGDVCPNTLCIKYKGNNILGMYEGYREEQNLLNKVKYYDLWNDKKIYKE